MENTQHLIYSDFGKNINAEGYQITYKGQSIGGAGIIGKYKGRGKGRINQMRDYAETAEREISHLINGNGMPRYYEVIDKINAGTNL